MAVVPTAKDVEQAARTEVTSLLVDVAQLLDGWKQTAPEDWTEWDQSVRNRITAFLCPTQETSSARCTCKDFPGADQFCTAHKAGGTGESPESQQQRNSEWDRQREQIAAGLAKNR